MAHLKVLALALLVMTAGCSRPQRTVPVKMKSYFDSEHARALLARGSNTISGSGVLRQLGGGVVTCAGNEVELIPATDYAQERMTAMYGSPEGGYFPADAPLVTFADSAPEYPALVRKTLCDAQGFFEFDKVSDGTFYLRTSIVWLVTSRNPWLIADVYTISKTGGYLTQRVTVSGGETVKVVMTAK